MTKKIKKLTERWRLLGNIIAPLFISCAYLFLYLPIVVLIVFSFNEAATPVGWSGFSLCWYKKLFYSPQILTALQTSLIVAVAATFLSVILGTCFVVAGRWFKSPLLTTFFYSNILLPEVVLAIGLLSIFSFFKIPLGFCTLIAGHTLLGLGFVVPIVRARFIELDPVLTEASLDLGGTYLQTFKRIIIPLLMPSLVASGLLVFTLSMDDFLISLFCSGPSVQTLAVYVYSMVKAGVDPLINAISACFLFISSMLVLLLCYLKIIDEVISYD